MVKQSLHIFIGIVTLFLRTCSTENLREDWIDPYDMSPSKDYLQFSDSITSMHAHFTGKNTDKPTLADAYFRRTINMLLNSVHEDFIEQDLYSGHLFFKIDAEKYAFLKSFANGIENEAADLERVDKILADILNKPTHQHLQEYLESWFHKCLNVILSREGIVFIIISTYAFVIFKLFHANLYSMRIVKFLFINFLLFDFIFTWIHLYQKAQAEDFVNKIKYKNVPDVCDPSSMNSLQFLVNIFTKEDECQKYYQIQYQDIFYKVTPGTVLTEMFARTIQYPAKSVGRAFGEMSYGIYDSLPIGLNLILTPFLLVIFSYFTLNVCRILLNNNYNSDIYYSFPWPLNIIILPIGLVFLFLMTCILVCIGFSMILSKPMKFNFLYLISFSFGGESVRNDMISGNNLERLLSMTQNQRQFIEDIPIQAENNIKQLKTEVSKVTESNKTKTDVSKTLETKKTKTDVSKAIEAKKSAQNKETNEKQKEEENIDENHVESLKNSVEIVEKLVEKVELGSGDAN